MSRSILLVGMVIAGVATTASAKQDELAPALPYACTLENVAGAYGFNEDTLSSAITGTPLAVVGILELRADGTATVYARGFGLVGGDLLPAEPRDGVWDVDPTCVGFLDFPEFLLATDTTEGIPTEVDLQFVAVENASELFFIQNNPLEEGDAKLLFRR